MALLFLTARPAEPGKATHETWERCTSLSPPRGDRPPSAARTALLDIAEVGA